MILRQRDQVPPGTPNSELRPSSAGELTIVDVRLDERESSQQLIGTGKRRGARPDQHDLDVSTRRLGVEVLDQAPDGPDAVARHDDDTQRRFTNGHQ
jgi:hypothetical protein